MYFLTLFHSHVFQKNTNNITQTPLPNGPQILERANVRVVNMNQMVAIGPCSPMAPVVTFELGGSIPRNYPAKKEEEYESNGLDG